MALETFISRNVVAIDAHIRRQVPGIEIDDDVREDWILNDESLYTWALEEGVDFEA